VSFLCDIWHRTSEVAEPTFQFADLCAWTLDPERSPVIEGHCWTPEDQGSITADFVDETTGSLTVEEMVTGRCGSGRPTMTVTWALDQDVRVSRPESCVPSGMFF
jgi:hypothetical protein